MGEVAGQIGVTRPDGRYVSTMPVAYLPSPASSIWHLGTIPVRAYALCMVAGVLAGLWLTDRRYRKARDYV